MKKKEWKPDYTYVLWALDPNDEVVICCNQLTWEGAAQDARGIMNRHQQVSCVVIERNEAVLVDVVRRG